nr:unnamed protein product [Callosobruchus analis]
MELEGRQAAEIVNRDQHLNICIRVGPECTQASAPAWAASPEWPERIRQDARTGRGGILCANGARLRRRPYSGKLSF